jgi:FlaG/FlaF family flagellin (archaellin)
MSDTENEEFAQKPIPKWITVYGFAFLIILCLLIILITYTIKVPEVAVVPIIVSKENVRLKIDSADLNKIIDSDSVIIKVPIKGKHRSFTVRVDRKNLITEGRNKIVTVTMNVHDKRYLEAAGMGTFNCEVIVRRLSLINKIIARK